MVVIKEQSIKVNGVLNGEKFIVKTRAIDKSYNEQNLVIMPIVMPLSKYLELKQYDADFISDIEPFIIQGLGVIEIPWNVEVLTSWQAQNELVKAKLIELGVPETAIEIVEDITE